MIADVLSRMGGITSLISSAMGGLAYAFMIYFIYAIAKIVRKKAAHQARNLEIL